MEQKTSDKLKNAGVYTSITSAIIMIGTHYFPSLEDIKEPLFVIINVALVAMKTIIEKILNDKGYDINFTRKDGK